VCLSVRYPHFNLFTICSGLCFLALPIPCSFHTSLSHPNWYRNCRALQVLPRGLLVSS
jgi:hypothetical protein